MSDLIAPTKIIDFLLRLVGIGLAGGSLYLVLRMTSLTPTAPAIYGREFLSIYARPRKPLLVARRSYAPKGVDFTPVGSLSGPASHMILTDFDLIETTSEVVTIRTSLGRLVRARPGVRLAGAGTILSIRRIDGRWVVRTTKGLIEQLYTTKDKN